MAQLSTGFHLYVQELRALTRGRYVWYGLACLYALFLFLMVGPGLRELEVYLQTVYLIAPAVFAPVAALQFAGPRSTRFVQAVYTTPVRQSTYFFAKLGVLLSAGALYFLATLPLVILYWMHVGVPPVYVDHMLGGALLILFAIAFGSFVGIVFTGRSVAAPVTVSLLPFLLLFGIPLVTTVQERLAHDLEVATWQLLALRALHLGPHVNIMESLGVPSWAAGVEDPSLALTMFLLSMAGLLATAFWIYLMHQSTETWKDTRGARALVLLMAALFLALPMLPPVATYTSEDRFFEGLDGAGPRGFLADAQLVRPGAHPVPGVAEPRLPIGETVQRDLYLLFFSPSDNQSFVEVNVTLEGTEGIVVEGAKGVTIDFDEGESFDSEANNSVTFGGRVPLVLRLPVVIEAREGDSLTHIQYRIPVHTNVTVQENSTEGPGDGIQYIEGWDTLYARAEVPGAVGKAWLAGGLLPVGFLVTGIVRDLRRR